MVLADDVYGGTYRLLTKVLGPWGLSCTTVDMGDPDAVRGALRDETRFVWIETPSNPLLKIVDIAAVAAVAHEAGATVVVDNTFATPALQRPLALGADVVVHSVTKYIGGHSDLLGGAIVTSDAGLIEALGFLVYAVGAVPGPMDSFLALRGLKTLGVRMRQHGSNAAVVARFLADHPIGQPGVLSGPRRASRSRRRGAADGRLRRDGLLHGRVGRRGDPRRASGPRCSCWPSRSAPSSR